MFWEQFFMIVQKIDMANRVCLGNVCDSALEADAFASGIDRDKWGGFDLRSTQRISRLKDLKPAEKICTCTTLELFRAGCGCGAIIPYKQVY